jgi:hypothetical protein
MYFYHIELEEYYGPGTWSSAYCHFREKYRGIRAMTETSFITALSCDFLPKVVRAE